MSAETRVRFAPSPTGYLHIGGVRTALYNYLYARHREGKFILRIEDTDRRRSQKNYTEAILRGMRWLGMEPDEGPYYQSKRKNIYDRALKKLIETGSVYKCYCTPEELKKERELTSGMGYSGRCRNIGEAQKKQFSKEKQGFVYRLKTPGSGNIVFKDLVKGEIEIDSGTLSDFIILKSDGLPTYNFACAVDDDDLNISHVIRGDDHISNTPKQILICRALKKKHPKFAHLPQVHGKDGKKLSKRTGAVSLEEYKKKGYLPGALKNYLALLGWSTSDSQQLFQEQELIEKFDISRCNSSSAIFDIEKLDWINGKYIRVLTVDKLYEQAKPWLIKENLKPEKNKTAILKAIKAEKNKIKVLSELPSRIDFLVNERYEYRPEAVQKRLKKEGVKKIIEDLHQIFKTVEFFKKSELEDNLRGYCQDNSISGGKIFHPLRVAVSGRMKGPGVFEILEILGREKVLDRIEYTLENILNDGGNYESTEK